eukprot:37459_1
MNAIIFCIIPVFIITNIEAQFNSLTTKLSETMSWHFAGVYNDTFTVGAGSVDNGRSTSHTSIKFSELNMDQWILNTVAMPLNISGFWNDCDQTVQIEHKIFIINPMTFGGTAISGHELFIYDLLAHQYSIRSTPTYRVYFQCTASDGNIIYAIGGWYNQVYYGYTQRYMISNNTWILEGGLTKIARRQAGCSFDGMNSHLYLFSGYNGTFLNSIEKYSVSNNEWSIISGTISTPRRLLKCRLLSTDSNIYCMGGTDRSAISYLDVVDIFNPITENITNTIYLNVGRTFFAATLWNNDKCIIISGGHGSSGILDSIETFGVCPGLKYSEPSQPTTLTPTTNEPTLSSNPSLYPTSYPSLLKIEPTNNPIPNNPTINEPTFQPTEEKTDDDVESIFNFKQATWIQIMIGVCIIITCCCCPL